MKISQNNKKILIFSIVAFIILLGVGFTVYLLVKENMTGSIVVTKDAETANIESFKTFGDVTIGKNGEYIIGQTKKSGIEKNIVLSENLSGFSYEVKYEGDWAYTDFEFIDTDTGEILNKAGAMEYDAGDGFKGWVFHLFPGGFYSCQKNPCTPTINMKIIFSSRGGESSKKPAYLILRNLRFSNAYDDMAEIIIGADLSNRDTPFDPELCNFQRIDTLKSRCLSKANKPSPTAIVSNDQREINRELAVKEQNIELCSKAEHLANECVADIGIAKKDITICDIIDNSVLLSSPNPKTRCYIGVASQKETAQSCDEIKKLYKEKTVLETYKNQCIIKFAIRTGDVTACNQLIADEPDVNLTKDKCYLDTASFNKQTGWCDLIHNELLKSYCMKSASNNKY